MRKHVSSIRSRKHACFPAKRECQSILHNHWVSFPKRRITSPESPASFESEIFKQTSSQLDLLNQFRIQFPCSWSGKSSGSNNTDRSTIHAWEGWLQAVMDLSYWWWWDRENWECDEMKVIAREEDNNWNWIKLPTPPPLREVTSNGITNSGPGR